MANRRGKDSDRFPFLGSKITVAGDCSHKNLKMIASWHVSYDKPRQCWRRLLRVPWTARRSNQSILREINPEYSLEGLMLQYWKLLYFGQLMWTADSLEKTQMLGKIDGRRRRGCQRMRRLEGITDVMNMNLGKLWEMMRDREAWCVTVAKSRTLLGDWKTTFK